MRSFQITFVKQHCGFDYRYALTCLVISLPNELACSRQKDRLNPCSYYVVIRSSNLLFVFAAPPHFASSANQSGGWRMHVRRQRRTHVFLRPLPIHNQPTPLTTITTIQTVGCCLKRRIIVRSESCIKRSGVGSWGAALIEIVEGRG